MFRIIRFLRLLYLLFHLRSLSAKSETEREDSQYVRLCKARSDARLIGKREKKAKQKAEEEAAKGKK
jgi:hypothetical protein